MRTPGAVISLILALAMIAGVIGWAMQGAFAPAGASWREVAPYLPWVIAGGLTVAAVIAAFVGLAIYSSRHGYDDPPEAR
jgi:hypothetical protein